jgi:hypothetical protein
MEEGGAPMTLEILLLNSNAAEVGPKAIFHMYVSG